MVEVKDTEIDRDRQRKREKYLDIQHVCIEFEIYYLNIIYNTKYCNNVIVYRSMVQVCSN